MTSEFDGEEGRWLEESVLRSNALYTSGGFESGVLSDFRVSVGVLFYGYVYADEWDDVRMDGLSESKLASTWVVDREAPFVDCSGLDGDVRAAYSNTTMSAAMADGVDFLRVESVEDFFLFDGWSYDYLLIEDVACDRKRWLAVDVSYELVGELRNGGELEPRIVGLDVGESVSDVVYEGLSSLRVQYKYDEDEFEVSVFPELVSQYLQKDFVRDVIVLGLVVGVVASCMLLLVSLLAGSFIGSVGSVLLFGSIGLLLAWLRRYSVIFYGFSRIIDSGSVVGVDVERAHRLSELSSSDSGLCESSESGDESNSESVGVCQRGRVEDVVVVPSGEQCLEACSFDVEWSVSGGWLESEVIEFFVEYGVENGFDRIETVMVDDASVVPDQMPVLESDCGEWFLLPEDTIEVVEVEREGEVEA